MSNNPSINTENSKDSAFMAEVHRCLIKSVHHLFPGCESNNLARCDIENSCTKEDATENKDSGLITIEQKDEYFYFIPKSDKIKPFIGCRIALCNPASSQDLWFARKYMTTFQQDIELCLESPKPFELWRGLRQTQFLRAIASSFGYEQIDALTLVQSMESSMVLTYEGRPIQYQVLIVPTMKDAERFKKNVIRFKEYLSVQDALLEERWIRAVVDGERVALICIPRNGGQVIGFLSLTDLPLDELRSPGDDVRPRYSPHTSLSTLHRGLEKEDILLIASPKGDLFILHGNGAIFQKSQGIWRQPSYQRFHRLLCELVHHSVAEAVLQAVIDLSFERKGSLFCIVEHAKSVDTLVSDRALPLNDRVNAVLRSALSYTKITRWGRKDVIASAASTDGAVIFNTKGEVLDISCMITRATKHKMKKYGFDRPVIYPGARSNAAWRASLYGMAIKVSEDGPIKLWHHGIIKASTE